MDLSEGDASDKRSSNSTLPTPAASENLNACFDCNICLDSCHEPVVTLCGHLYCWPCIYKWLQTSSDSDDQPKCPVCKADISNSSLVPLYGRGRSPESKKPQLDLTNLPPRPPALGTNALLVNPNPMQLENEVFHQQLRNYTIGGPSATNSSFSPTINMVGEIVFAGMFGSQDTNLFAYPHTNSYPFPGNGSPRLRRQEIQVDKSLNRVSIFLFCCIALCLVLF